MTPETLLAAVSGTSAAAGLTLVAAWAAGYAPPPRPPRWRATPARWGITPRRSAIALAAGLVTFAATGWPVAGLAAVPAVITMPRMLSRQRAKARIAALEALESWTRRLADVLAASRGLEDALTHSAASAPPAIAGPVQDLAARMRARTTTTSQALTAFADAVDDPVGDLIASALMLAAERRGPGLRQVLAELAADVARDVDGRREVEAERAHYRSSLKGIVVFLAGYLLLLLANRSYSAPFATPAGQAVLAAVAGCWAAGLYWLNRLAEITGPQRFLQKAGGFTNSAPGAQDQGRPGRRP